ncbi:DUF2125 domain-containing protein [Aquidulcibacter sp.]|jgi:hypothetical protein|uniref:DUF2125 domain-containing protein n=1 Tax=Aquidulcibacter sp. TaxID=2052990 RepID=UPI0037BEB0A7
MSETRSGSLGGLIIPLAVGGLVLAGYYVYWKQTAQRIQMHVAQALPALPQESFTVTGFPYRFEARIAGLRVQTGTGFVFEASRFVAAASPFNLNLWALEGALEPQLKLPGGPLRPLQATDLKASLRLKEGQLARFSLTFEGLQAGTADPSGSGLGPRPWRTGAGALHLIADPKDASRLAFALDLSALELSALPEGPAAILGNKIDHLRLTGPISQGQTLLRSTKAWAKAQGEFTIMAAQIDWGPLSFDDGTGRLKVTPEGQWQGEIRGQGALKPNGMAIPALSAPIEIGIEDGQARLLGFSAARVPKAFN